MFTRGRKVRVAVCDAPVSALWRDLGWPDGLGLMPVGFPLLEMATEPKWVGGKVELWGQLVLFERSGQR